MNGPAPHTQLDADLAAGMGMPDNGPKLMSAQNFPLLQISLSYWCSRLQILLEAKYLLVVGCPLNAAIIAGLGDKEF